MAIALVDAALVWLEALASKAIDQGVIPDWAIRRLVRWLSHRRLSLISTGSLELRHQRKIDFINSLKSNPVAIHQKSANEQHYEVATEFIQSCLGSQMKYSCCSFPRMSESLDEGELIMLRTYCQRALLEDGFTILDLGCGWGSLSLFLAQRYPNASIVALSNSRTQKEHIDKLAKERQLFNLTVYTGDVMVFDFSQDLKFDRIVSIEMLEHMKNYEFLFKKISDWLKPEGLFFAHTFCHILYPYNFEAEDGWMAQNFFSGGTMPSLDLFTYFQKHLNLERSWFINGHHYARTSELWLKRLDSNRKRWLFSLKDSNQKSMDKRSDDLGTIEEQEKMRKTFYRFRTFFIAVAEFFAMENGEAWGVGHFLFSKK